MISLPSFGLLSDKAHVIYAFNDIYDLFNSTEYKKIFLRYKKLIQFHKPKINEDKHNNYISLWYYAIKTVIKLQKYIGRKKHYIFDLIKDSAEEISEFEDSALLLPNKSKTPPNLASVNFSSEIK